jgi:GNAT superfamily N-acetyltransferase
MSVDLLCEQIPSPSEGQAWKRAYDFHQEQANQSGYVRHRSDAEIKELAQQGQLFGARWAGSDSFIGLCYVQLTPNEWEVGGLTVEEHARRLGVGTFLLRICIAHTIVWSPQLNDRAIIAHVHIANREPRGIRGILDSLGFVEHAETVTFPAERVPEGMETDPEGNIVTNKFTFSINGLRKLTTWFQNFEETLGSGVKVHIDLGEILQPDTLKDALNEIMSEVVQQRIASRSSYLLSGLLVQNELQQLLDLLYD